MMMIDRERENKVLLSKIPFLSIKKNHSNEAFTLARFVNLLLNTDESFKYICIHIYIYIYIYSVVLKREKINIFKLSGRQYIN